jgi:Ca2+-binding RTX toxin-like protein
VFDHQLTGGDGRDFLWAIFGNDTLSGGLGSDTLVGGFGSDTLIGDPGYQRVPSPVPGAENVNDFLSGGPGNDTLWGDGQFRSDFGGNDTLHGGKGNDHLYGDLGNDQLYGDRGADTMTGGLGADSFHTGTDRATDVITDFNPAEDKLVLAYHQHVLSITSPDGTYVDIKLSGGAEVILQNLHLPDLRDPSHVAWIIGG